MVLGYFVTKEIELSNIEVVFNYIDENVKEREVLVQEEFIPSNISVKVKNIAFIFFYTLVYCVTY